MNREGAISRRRSCGRDRTGEMGNNEGVRRTYEVYTVGFPISGYLEEDDDLIVLTDHRSVTVAYGSSVDQGRPREIRNRRKRNEKGNELHMSANTNELGFSHAPS